MAGAEKALVSLLKCLNKDSLNVDLYVFEGNGTLQSQVPEWVNIIEADEVTRAMTLEARYYLRDIIKKGYFSAALARVMLSVYSKLGIKVFSWGKIKKYIPSLNKRYDVAIGFLEGLPDFFVIDKVNASKKIGYIHIDMSNIELTENDISYYKQFDNLVTISNECRTAACKAIPGIEGKISVIENVVSSQEVIEQSLKTIDVNWNQDKTNIVTVGRLEYQKGIDIAAKAARVLKEKEINYQWHIYGVGSMENEIRKIISENGLENDFILEGLASNPYPLMKKADIIVQPSRWEGKSIVLDEAKILGKPIVVTNYASVSDQIINNKNGIIVDMNPEAIADGIRMLIDDEKLKQMIGYNCMNEKTNQEEVVDKFYSIIGI